MSSKDKKYNYEYTDSGYYQKKLTNIINRVQHTTRERQYKEFTKHDLIIQRLHQEKK